MKDKRYVSLISGFFHVPPKKKIVADPGRIYSVLREEGQTDVFFSRKWYFETFSEEEWESGEEDEDSNQVPVNSHR